MLRFAHTYLLHLLWLLPVLVIFYAFVFRWKKNAMKKFGNLDLLEKLAKNVSKTKQVWKIIFIMVAIFFMIFAGARPQIGTKLEEVQREGIDIVVAMDVSKSMLAEDIQPSRLAKAKHEVKSLLDRLRGDRIGLIAFAGVAFVQCPLTLDYGAAEIFLDVMEPGLIPTPGTDLSSAIKKAMDTFDKKERKYKVMVLITDGEDHRGDALKLAEEAEREGIIIYTVGIGSPKGVPIPAESSNQGYRKDRSGQVIMTKLDEVTLEKVSLQTGGKYFRATTGEDELDKIYDDIANMEKKELGSVKFSQFEDRFQYMIAFALFFLILEVFITERRKVKQEWRGRFM